jgi:hypothetical protein
MYNINSSRKKAKKNLFVFFEIKLTCLKVNEQSAFISFRYCRYCINFIKRLLIENRDNEQINVPRFNGAIDESNF